ncbi:hypothetical protein MHTCC0001_14610 [Flavobacteriaceae bacterium MHTCC 0001]
MNILHLSGVNGWGGGENHIENLCHELSQSHPEIKNIIFCVKKSPFHKKLKATDLGFVTAKLNIKLDPLYANKLIKICKKRNINIIHIHDPTALQLAIIADKLAKLPPFVFSKKTSFKIKKRKKTLFKYNYPKIKKILCVSDETKRIAEKAIEKREKLLTIYHGTNLKTKSDLTPFLLRQEYNIDKETCIVGNIANHIEAKNLDTLINVANRIVNKKKRTDFIFVQIGTFTKLTPPLLERVEALHLKKNMLFLGYMPNASNFIPQFDMCLMTSESEGIPQFIYESMYHKKPVVSTDVGGIPEVIENEKNGLLAPKYDDKLLAKHILKLHESSQLVEQFTTVGYEKLVENFTTDIMVQKTLDVYKQILKKA